MASTDRGDVVGYHSVGMYLHAFRWSQGVMTDLGDAAGLGPHAAVQPRHAFGCVTESPAR